MCQTLRSAENDVLLARLVGRVGAEVRQEVHEATAPDDKEDCEKAGRIWDNAGKTCVEKQ